MKPAGRLTSARSQQPLQIVTRAMFAQAPRIASKAAAYGTRVDKIACRRANNHLLEVILPTLSNRHLKRRARMGRACSHRLMQCKITVRALLPTLQVL